MEKAQKYVSQKQQQAKTELAAWIEDNGVKQEVAAQQCGVSTGTISNILADNYVRPTTVSKIMRGLRRPMAGDGNIQRMVHPWDDTRCPQCKNLVPGPEKGGALCYKCGHHLGKQCPSCEKVNLISSSRCCECGEELPKELGLGNA